MIYLLIICDFFFTGVHRWSYTYIISRNYITTGEAGLNLCLNLVDSVFWLFSGRVHHAYGFTGNHFSQAIKVCSCSYLSIPAWALMYPASFRYTAYILEVHCHPINIPYNAYYPHILIKLLPTFKPHREATWQCYVPEISYKIHCC